MARSTGTSRGRGRNTAPDRDQGLWTTGQVASALGVSPVTLRSWDARYGLGPTTRESGRHRRYSDTDVARLRTLNTMIARGMPTREAAELCRFADPVPAAVEFRPGVAEIEEAAAGSRPHALAGLLADLLNSVGTIAAWQDVLAPALQGIGQRWQRHGDCIDVEWALSEAVSFAFEQYRRELQPLAPTPAVLLSSCPGERHILPLRALTVALAEHGIHSVLLGEGVPATNIGIAADRLQSTVVVLWSLMPDTADTELASTLARTHLVCCAGPGWTTADTADTTEISTSNELAHATDTVRRLVGQR